MAASEVTITFSKIATPYAGTHGIVQVLIEWLASTSNAGGVTSTAFDATDTIDILGRYCVLAVTDPGSPAPTDDYSIAINDEYGVDVFGGNLGSRDTANSEQAAPLISAFTDRRLCAGVWTFVLTGNSVSGATGKCILYFAM